MGTTQQDIINLITKHSYAAGIVVSINTFNDFFNWGKGSLFDPETNRTRLQKGIYAYVLGRCIVVSKVIPDGEVVPVSNSFLEDIMSKESKFTRVDLIKHLRDYGMTELANILQMDEALL